MSRVSGSLRWSAIYFSMHCCIFWGCSRQERLRGNARELLAEILRIVEGNLFRHVRYGLLSGEAGLLKDSPDLLIMETAVGKAAAACRIKSPFNSGEAGQSAVSGIFKETVSAPPGPAVFSEEPLHFPGRRNFPWGGPGRREDSFQQPACIRSGISRISVQYSRMPAKSRVVFRGFFGGFLEAGQDFLLVLGPGQEREAEFVQTVEFQGKLGGQCFLQRK